MRGRLLRVVCLCALACAAALAPSCSNDDSLAPRDVSYPVEGIEGARVFEWAIGPIDGITTAWHQAPSEIFVPVGTTIQFKCGGFSEADVHWVNAHEVHRDENGTIAEFRVETAGRHEILVEIPGTDSGGGSGGGGGTVVDEPPAAPGSDGGGGTLGADVALHSCVINGVSATAKDYAVSALEVTAAAMPLTESSSNLETLYSFFAGGERFQEISALREVGQNYYVTAVNRMVVFEASVSDPRFASLIEVRVPGQRPFLATRFERILTTKGRLGVSMGAVSVPRNVTIQTYETVITSHTSFVDIVPENTPITFTAKTDPSGFEDDITWISSTKFGVATPVVGHGPTFQVTFSKTWGPHDDMPLQPYQWLGVRADNAAFNQDAKPVDNLKTFSVQCKGGVEVGGLIVLTVHCPAPPACTPTIPAGDDPGVTAAGVVCTASSGCEDAGGAGSAAAVATNLAAGLTASGCPAVAGPTAGGSWQVVFVLPPACSPDDVACAFENAGGGAETFGLGGCPLLLESLVPITNVCNGVISDHRAAWVSGYKFSSP